MKRILAFLLCCFMLTALLVPAYAAVGDPENTIAQGESENISWTVDSDGTLTIFGSGDMPDYSYPNRPPWWKYCNEVKKVVVCEGVTSIGCNAFSRAMYELREVVLPDGLKRIEDYAFSDCQKLVKINLPDSLESVGIGAFVGTAIYSYSENWQDGVFYYDGWLLSYENDDFTAKQYTVKEGTVGIADGAMETYYTDFALSEVTLPDSLHYIGEDAFLNVNLTEITIPASVLAIGQRAFGYWYASAPGDWVQEGTVEGFVVKGYDDTAAEEYALNYDLTFTSLGDAPTPSETPVGPKPSEEIISPDQIKVFRYQYEDDDGTGSWSWAAPYIYTCHDWYILTGSNDKFLPDNDMTRAEAVTALLIVKGVLADKTVTSSGFIDADDEWYTPYVAAAKANGLTSGYEDGTFHPNDTITRAEFITMALRAMEIDVDESATSSGFTDGDGRWYTPYLAAAKANELLSGYADGSVHPMSTIIRAEAAVILSK